MTVSMQLRCLVICWFHGTLINKKLFLPQTSSCVGQRSVAAPDHCGVVPEGRVACSFKWRSKGRPYSPGKERKIPLSLEPRAREHGMCRQALVDCLPDVGASVRVYLCWVCFGVVLILSLWNNLFFCKIRWYANKITWWLKLYHLKRNLES